MRHSHLTDACLANSAALRMAGITATSADPPSGTVVRLGDRTPVGVLIEGGALEPVRRLLPAVTEAQRAPEIPWRNAASASG